MGRNMFRRTGSYVGRHHIGLLALFIALSGTAYAATAAKNSVKTKSIKNGAVTNAKLGTSSVNGVKVLDGSLTGVDLLDGSVANNDLAAGAIGDPAFAKVAPSGTKSQDRGVIGIDHVAASGTYCFDLTFTPNNAVATINAGPAPPFATTAQVQIPGGPSGLGCGAPFDDAGVRTGNTTISCAAFPCNTLNSVQADHGFFVQFD
jgi:hypothetical protein